MKNAIRISDAEAREAYQYFAQNKLTTQRYKVVETDSVPKTKVQGSWGNGADLTGIGPIPPIAGRSAIYTFRQLYDFKSGVRHGAWSAMMKPAVQNLTRDDMIAIVAYTSSRMP